MGKGRQKNNKPEDKHIEQQKEAPQEQADAPLVSPFEMKLLIGVAVCFFLSGFAALLYQTAWLRQFSIVFGTSELAIAAVLAAYMAGLAGGAALISRYIDQIRRPILTYGVLEAGIAITALAIPFLVIGSQKLLVLMLGHQAEPPDSSGFTQMFFYLVTAFVLLALPTGFMGATLPLLTRYAVNRQEEVGSRVALLYGINTAGAVAGTLAAGFLLLPTLGLSGTVWTGVFFNFVVFLVAAWLAKLIQDQKSAATNIGSVSESITTGLAESGWSRYHLILPLMFVSGANSFLYEILWTRMLGHVLGGSVYAFATMLATFLTGIALGSALIGRFASSKEKSIKLFIAVQFCIGVLSAITYQFIEQLVPEARTLFSNVLFSAAVMLPATLFIGATFPLAVRILTNDERDVASSTARVYAWNTVGAIAGAIAAGFYIISTFGFQGSIKIAIAINLLLAILSLMLHARPKYYLVLGCSALLVPVLFVYSPSRPAAVIQSSVFSKKAEGEEIFYAVGQSSTVYMTQRDDFFHLRTNGLPEASISQRGTPPTRNSQQWLGALPVLVRPDVKSMLIVGLGGGVALEGVPASVEDIDVVELEHEVMRANEVVQDLRAINPLEQENLKVIFNDARSALTLTDKKYDAIVSQPSHPWTAGASHLYTREFVALAKQRLAPGGVYLQWINTGFVDENLLRVLVATLFSEFEYVRLYQPTAQVLEFVASDQPFNVEQQLKSSNRPISDDPAHYAQLGLFAAEDLIGALMLDEEGLRAFAAGVEPNTDNFNVMATQSRSLGDGITTKELVELLAPYDPLMNTQSDIYRDYPDLKIPYIAWYWVSSGMHSRAAQLAERLDLPTSLLINAMGMIMSGRAEVADGLLLQAIEEKPDFQQARYMLIRRYLGRLAKGDAPQRIQQEAELLTGAAKAVLEGWRLAFSGEWRKLRAMDSELAQTETTDLWFAEAAKLMAEWRLRFARAENNGEFVIQAERLLESAVMTSWLSDLLVLRAGAGVLRADPYVFVGSLNAYADMLDSKLERAQKGEFKFSREELQMTLTRLDGMIKQLSADLVKPISVRASATTDRLAEIRKQITAYK